MLRTTSAAALAIAALTGAAMAATTGNVSSGSSFGIDAPIMIGDMISVPDAPAAGSGVYAAVTEVDSFTFSSTGTNAGVVVTFGAYTFTITSTVFSGFDNANYELFALGTTTGGVLTDDPTSLRFTAAGAQQNSTSTQFYSVFIATPPEDFRPPNEIPLPASLPLLAVGLGAVALMRRRKA